MAYLLRALISLMVLGMGLTVATALDFVKLPWNHISLSIAAFLHTVFAQAFVIFYFIGVHRLLVKITTLLHSGNRSELFASPPPSIAPYIKKTDKLRQDAHLCKRQTLPWGFLMLALGSLAFLLGGAHDTGLVARTTHAGVAYGFTTAMLIGFFRQWRYLKKAHLILRKIKKLYQIPDAQM